MRILPRPALVPPLVAVLAAWPGPAAAAALPTCLGLPASIVGTAGDDRIVGTPGNDVIVARAGDDLIDALAGNDVVCAGTGSDDLDGRRGADVLHGEQGNDKIFGGDDADDIVGGRGPDLLVGGPGADGLFAGADADVLRAGAGPDAPLIGGGGDDLIDGGTDGATVSFLFASQSVIVDLSMGTATGEGQDVVSRLGNVIGSRFGDLIIGTDGSDRLEGEDGDDRLQGLGGDDVLVGGRGNDGLEGGDGSRDEARFTTARASVDVDLTAGTASGQGADTVVGIEAATGSAFSDRLQGDAVANTLSGWDGDDVISGLAGDDYLRGQRGGDTLNGGDGDDTCEDGEVVVCEHNVVTDPTFILRITHPQHGQVLSAARFHAIRGNGTSVFERLRRVDAALRKLTPEGCRWWSARRSILVPRPCNSPLWLPTTFDGSGSWALPLENGLTAGVYRAVARGNRSDATLEGEQIVDFRLI